MILSIKMPKPMGILSDFASLFTYSNGFFLDQKRRAMPQNSEWVSGQKFLVTTTPLRLPWEAFNSLRHLWNQYRYRPFSRHSSAASVNRPQAILHLNAVSHKPSNVILLRKISVTTKLNLWRRIFSYLAAFMGGLKPELLQNVVDFIWGVVTAL